MEPAILTREGWANEPMDSLARRGADSVCCVPYVRPARLGPDWIRTAAGLDPHRLASHPDTGLRFALAEVAFARDAFDAALDARSEALPERSRWGRAIRAAIRIARNHPSVRS